MFGRWSPLRVTLVYASFGALWIVGSDRVASWAFPTLSALHTVQTAKGLLFILLTSALVFLLVRAAARNVLASEERYRSAVDTMSDALIILEPDGTIRLVNRAFTEIYGYTSDEIIGTNCRKLIHPDYHQVYEQFVIQIRETGGFRGQTIDLRKDGSPVNTEVAGARIRFEKRDCLLAVIRDVTQRTQTERALHSAELLNREIIETAQEGIIVFDRELRYVLWNPYMERLTDVEAAQVLGQHALDVFPGLQEIGIADLLRRALAGETVTSHDLRSPLPHLRDRAWYVGTYTPRRDASGEIIGVIAIIHDITERKLAEIERAKLEAQLRQAQKMEAIGQLAGGVAHDFNNILTIILGNVELGMHALRRSASQESSLTDALEQIELGARRASALTRQLLAFSRRQVIQPEVINLNDLLAELDKMMRRLITENITLTIDASPLLRSVLADAGQLQQIIVNLVINAADAMPDGGRLTIETENVELDESYAELNPEARPGLFVRLAVTDTGCGIDAAVRERIFEPFYTTKPIDKGTGLGLATVYGIVRQSGGHIVVYSEPGQGATFKIYLPAVENPALKSGNASPPSEHLGGSERILLCEDDEAVRRLTAQLLESVGYAVIAADSGQHALDLAANPAQPIDMLITDVIMPEFNGRELAEKVRSLRPDLPTLFISGYTANVIAHHGVLKQDVAFLEKPFTRNRLLLRVHEVLRASRHTVAESPCSMKT